jgi:hypothetical protein
MHQKIIFKKIIYGLQHITNFMFVLVFLALYSCEQKYSGEEVKQLLEKGKKEDLVKAFYLIGKNKDTSFLKDVIANPYDPRIVHVLQFYGMSVYQSKMTALKKISGMMPPKKITYEPDPALPRLFHESMFQCWNIMRN